MNTYASFSYKEQFYVSVWALVKSVPAGRVVAYGQLATMLAAPQDVAEQTYRAFGARWVGGAMANCPADVPWQRVVNAAGKLSVRNAERQRVLLEQEGICFDKSGRIDMARYRWVP